LEAATQPQSDQVGRATDISARLGQAIRTELDRRIATNDSNANEGWGVRAHKAFVRSASAAVRERLTTTDDIAVGELASASFNASAIPVPGGPGRWVIALNDGVSKLVYEVARAIARSLNVSAGPMQRETAVSNSEAARLLHERFAHYIYLGVPYGTESPATSEQIFLASSATTMAERFAYLHEISHVLLKHDDQAPLRLLPDDWSGAEDTLHSAEQEHEADLLAWNLLCRTFVSHPAELQLAFAGSALLLQVAAILEAAGEVSAIGTHPPALVRLDYLRHAVSETAESVGAHMRDVEAIERALCGRLEEVMQLAPPLPGESPLDVLLTNASAPAVPDYMTFQENVLTMLSRAAPTKLCKGLGIALGKAEKELRDLGVLGERARDVDPHLDTGVIRAARGPFNRLKLIQGLIGLYLIPEISRFIERHREEYLRVGHDGRQ
jgi:hypothetical protein